jgi:hypothetical protein
LVATGAGPSQTNANQTVVANKYIVIHLSLGSPLESPFCFVMTFITRFARTVKQNPPAMFCAPASKFIRTKRPAVRCSMSASVPCVDEIRGRDLVDSYGPKNTAKTSSTQERFSMAINKV